MLSEKRINIVLEREVFAWLQTGVNNPDGRLALFDGTGQRIEPHIQRAALSQGWAEGWFANPMRPDWMVCRLTVAGQQALVARQRVSARLYPA